MAATGSAAQPASSPALLINKVCKNWRRDRNIVISFSQADITQAAGL
jgi:hypothetical protein